MAAHEGLSVAVSVLIADPAGNTGLVRVTSRSFGHQVRLMPAKDVKAYVKRNRYARKSGAAPLSSLRGPNTSAAPAFHTSAPSSAAGTTRHSSRSGTIVRTHIPGGLYRTVGQHPTRERATGTRHLHVAIDHLHSTAVCRLTRPRFCSEHSAPSAVEFASCICVRHGNNRHSGAYARQKA